MHVCVYTHNVIHITYPYAYTYTYSSSVFSCYIHFT